MSSSPFPSFRPLPSDSVSHLIFLSRLYVSMAGREEQPVDALSRAMFRKAASEATPLADRLPLLSSLYGLLNGTSYIVDRRKTEQWDTLAEKIIHAAWAPARAGEEEILTPLCLLLRPGPGGGSLVPVPAGHRDKVWRRPGLLPTLGGPFLGGVSGAYRVDEPLFLYVPGPSLGQVGRRGLPALRGPCPLGFLPVPGRLGPSV